jgi:NAD(P)-dependent dehydrogenase (short-subunit alcohol dehydrogenase family)
MAIHDFELAKGFPAYCASRNAGTLLVQMYAQGVSPDDMQILSYHPGAIYTASVVKTGIPKEAYSWDDGMTIFLYFAFQSEVLYKC